MNKKMNKKIIIPLDELITRMIHPWENIDYELHENSIYSLAIAIKELKEKRNKESSR